MIIWTDILFFVVLAVIFVVGTAPEFITTIREWREE